MYGVVCDFSFAATFDIHGSVCNTFFAYKTTRTGELPLYTVQSTFVGGQRVLQRLFNKC